MLGAQGSRKVTPDDACNVEKPMTIAAAELQHLIMVVPDGHST
jgi:hypothetical protein